MFMKYLCVRWMAFEARAVHAPCARIMVARLVREVVREEHVKDVDKRCGNCLLGSIKHPSFCERARHALALPNFQIPAGLFTIALDHQHREGGGAEQRLDHQTPGVELRVSDAAMRRCGDAASPVGTSALTALLEMKPVKPLETSLESFQFSCASRQWRLLPCLSHFTCCCA